MIQLSSSRTKFETVIIKLYLFIFTLLRLQERLTIYSLTLIISLTELEIATLRNVAN